MDSRHATVIGRAKVSEGAFEVLGHIRNEGASSNSNENAAQNQERALRVAFFKDIAKLMPNVDEVYVTGTGDAQEQFCKFLAETPQYKGTKTIEATATRMGDQELVAAISAQFPG